MGRISPFGLMEMSRQRIRTGVLEGSTVPCPHCAGAGIVRATPSIALHVLRAVEEMLIKSNSHHLLVRTRTDVCLYILNQKRSHLRGLEDRFGVDITILSDDTHNTGTHAFAIERGELITNPRPIVIAPAPIESVDPEDEAYEDEEVEETEDEEETEEVVAREERAPREDRAPRQDRAPRGERTERADRPERGPRPEGDNGDNSEAGRKRRRRRRRRGGRGGEGRPEAYGVDGAPMPVDAPQPDVTGAPFGGTHTYEPDEAIADAATTEGLAMNEAEAGLTVPSPEDEANGRRRRGRRGGRRLRGERPEETDAVSSAEDESLTLASEAAVESAAETSVEATEAPAKPARKPRAPRRTKASIAAEAAAAEAAAAAPAVAEAPAEAPAEVAAPVQAAPVVAAPAAPEPVAAAEPEPVAPAPEPVTTEPVVFGTEPAAPRKAGWWAKAKSAISGG